MYYKKYLIGVLFLYMFMSGLPSGLCFDSYNSQGEGVLYIETTPVPHVNKFITADQLSQLWFYNLILTAKEETVYITQLGINLEAHLGPAKTWDAMVASAQNVKQVWLYVQQLEPDQNPIAAAKSFIHFSTPRFNAEQYRAIPLGEISSQKNMFVVEFKDINIAVAPEKKVVLSFFGAFNSDVASGFKVKGENLLPTWRSSAKDIRVQGRLDAEEFIVQ